MSILVFALVIGLAADPAAVPSQLPQAPSGQEWQLVWSDEFDGPTLDETKWERIGDSPRRDGFWVKEDAYLDGKGCLVLRTRKDGDRYTSGAIRTLGKFEHRHGFWEARCQFPKQQGHWPAFWMMPVQGLKDAEAGGAAGAEIDIMEKASLTEKINHAIHWDGYGEHHKSEARDIEQPGLNEGFHTFAVWWTPEEYVFYVDGRETWRTKAGGPSMAPSYAKLTEEIGPWAGKIADAALPDYFTVDYVRVYDLAKAQE
jgi:beta-glucanase (GH16 family)